MKKSSYESTQQVMAARSVAQRILRSWNLDPDEECGIRLAVMKRILANPGWARRIAIGTTSSAKLLDVATTICHDFDELLAGQTWRAINAVMSICAATLAESQEAVKLAMDLEILGSLGSEI